VFLIISISVPLRLPSLFLLCSSARCATAAPADHVPRTAAPALLRAEPRAASAQRHRFPEPRWPLPACHAARPSARAALHRRSPSLQPQRHLLLPVNPTRRSLADRRFNSPLPSSARATLTSSLSELRRGLHACRRPQTLPLAHCALFSNLKHVLSSICILSSTPATTSSLPFLFPDPAPHRTSAATTAHRRQPSSLPSSPNPVLLEHRNDHWCSQAHPISFSHARPPSPTAPASFCSAAARPCRRPAVAEPLHPRQRHQQHHINL
jgi:hypothetical protein